jgi:hypothetical protein
MQNLLTVQQAAQQAQVSVKAIYYHINVSNKLQLIYSNKRLYVSAVQLKQLYKAAPAGVKQRLTTVTYDNKRTTANTQQQQQAQALIAQAQAIIAQLQTVVA